MPREDYRSASARLSEKLDELRRDHAPADWLANALTALIQLHLGHQNLDAARLALAELDALRRPGEPQVEAEYSLSAARVMVKAAEATRAISFAERAISLGRRHMPSDFVGVALLELADALEPLGRDEESRWARIEAVERFEEAGRLDHASAVLVSLHEGLSPDEDPAGLQRAVALAERAGAALPRARAHKALGLWHFGRDEYLPARRALERALACYRQHDEADDLTICLTALARLEAEAFHHHEALALATEAAQAAPSPAWKAYALDASEPPLARLHLHDEARAVMLEMARCHEEEGDLEGAKDARQRARQHRVYGWLHRLPSWVYRPADLSTREAAARTHFQPLTLWLQGLGLGSMLLWTQLFMTGAVNAEDHLWGLVMVVCAWEPWAVLLLAGLLARWRRRPEPEFRTP